MTAKIYYSFTEKGEKKLPSREDVLRLSNAGITPVIFLDSCVCLDIIKIIDHKNKARNVDKAKIVNFKNCISDSQIHISPLFGLMELCYKDDKFDEDKFWDFNNRINFFEKIPKVYFKEFKFNYTRDSLDIERSYLRKSSPYYGLEPTFLYTYVSLLKIRELALKELAKNIAEKNCFDLINWMVDELGIVLGLEYKLGMNIFGGSTNFWKMIGIDGKNDLIKKKLIGTAWDILHSRLCTNNLKLSEMLSEPIEAYFLTDDYNLFKLLYKSNLSVIINNSKGHNVTTLSNSDYNLRHFDQLFLEKQNRLMIKLLTERFNKPIVYDLIKVKAMIEELEQRNNITL